MLVQSHCAIAKQGCLLGVLLESCRMQTDEEEVVGERAGDTRVLLEEIQHAER
jgi:hypothetical protein